MGCALASQQAQRNEADCTQHDGVRNDRHALPGRRPKGRSCQARGLFESDAPKHRLPAFDDSAAYRGQTINNSGMLTTTTIASTSSPRRQ
ncbi:hypothetical protein SAMN04488004_101133 [Loktanella salsilacus]|uniref:Uncharacterized protein n=1 Tax=Loktanella salsilacus TaxID=195913 RepID=A0A1I4BUD6_9RHOB|nr:hypothetical protein SAMN04488004_101133 [Loktanella salsilacus]